MKYKMIEIGSGWVLERFDEEHNDYKMYDFSDNKWFTSIWPKTTQPKEVIQQKYNELVLESEPTIGANVNQYRQKVESAYTDGWIIERAHKTDKKWTRRVTPDGSAYEFDWVNYDYRIHNNTKYSLREEQSKVEDHFNAGGMCEWVCEMEAVDGNDEWSDYSGQDGWNSLDFNWQTFNYRIKEGVDEFVEGSESVSWSSSKHNDALSMSRRDMIFSEYQRITDNCVQCDSVMTRHERLELAINTVDLIIKESENG